MKVVHCLGKIPETREILEIRSKDRALEQCARYLAKNYPEARQISVESTAYAAKEIAEKRMKGVAAIASRNALETRELEIIAEDICPNNRTRFLILGNWFSRPTGNDLTLMLLHPYEQDRPGVLNKITSLFAATNINLNSIQSRPDGNKGYRFYIEVSGHKDISPLTETIETLKLAIDEKGSNFRSVQILGSFPNTRWKDVE